MLYGQLKPTVVKLFRSRSKYHRWGLPLLKPLRVIAYDMKYLLVADEHVVGVYPVLWEDVQLVESEKVLQVPVIQTFDNSKIIDRRREKKPFFKAGTKSNK